MAVPANPFIFHITHVDNLLGILQQGGLWCDRQRIARQLSSTNIGHIHIKQRRLSREVRVAAGGALGDYVPFNFCQRSVMLYAVHRGHRDYTGGQDCIAHLVSTVHQAVKLDRKWAFTDRHAELAHALYFDELLNLSQVPWHVMDARYWSDVKEERQAEFLVHDFFPWTAVTEVAVMTDAAGQRVRSALAQASHQPPVTIHPEWYYE
jgi:ssDNA thymidine ADP-ribosyltransferase, DarT